MRLYYIERRTVMKQMNRFIILTTIFLLASCSTTLEEAEEAILFNSSSYSLSSDENSVSSTNSSTNLEDSSQKVEESSPASLTWSSMEEAIDFYEANVIADKGKEMGEAELNMEFYERDSWQLINHTGDTIVLSKNNVGIGGKDRIEFVKGNTTTVMTFFSANSPYPDRPTTRKIVRNSDAVTIESESLNPIDPAALPYADDPFDSFTAETVFEYLKEERDIGDDVFIQFSIFDDIQSYYELVLVSDKFQEQDSRKIVGIYRVYEDKTIKEITAE